MNHENYIETHKWFAWHPVKTDDSGWVLWKTVNRTIDERPVVYQGLLPIHTYSLKTK